MGHTVGAPVAGPDKAPLFEPFKQGEWAIGQNVTITGKAGDIMDLAIGQAFKMDRSALRQDVQNALFAF
jgi:hypothetical protein